MKKLLFFIAIACSAGANAQLVGGNAYLQGQYVEVGMNQCGGWGTTNNAPAGYHARSGTAINNPSDNTLNLGFVADPEKNGWDIGFPSKYNGDYFMPQNPWVGWGVSFNTFNYATERTQSTPSVCRPLNTYSAFGGSVLSVTSTAAEARAVWQGTNNGLQLTKAVTVKSDKVYFTIRITLKNTTALPMTNIYYGEYVNPDNDAFYHDTNSGGSINTKNSVLLQNPADNATLVTALGSLSMAYLGLGSKDCRSKVFRGNSPTTVSPAGSVASWYNGTGSNLLTGADVNYNGNSPIGIAFFAGTLPAGDSTSFAYTYILKSTDFDEALAETESLVQQAGTNYNTGSTIPTCSNTTVPISIQNGDNYAWNWATSSGTLSGNTGLSNTLTVGTSPATLTLTGVGACLTKTLTYTVKPTEPTVTLSTITQPTCAVPTGTIDINATATGLVPLAYSISGAGGPYTASPTFAGLTPGSYSVYVQNSTGPACSVSDPGNPIVITPPVQPSVTAPANQTVCNGGSTATINFTGSSIAGTTYNWTNNNTSIGLAASGTGDINAFTATNATAAPVTATITVTPTAGTCTAAPSQTFTITVNPSTSVNAITSRQLCNGQSAAPVIMSGGVPGTTYAWTNDNASVGLPASGTGDIAAFTVTNATASPITANITVTPSFTANGVTCSGTPKSFSITVNPSPNVAAVPSQTVCAGSNTTAVSFTGTIAGTTYSWVNDNPAIGLAAGGTGNIPSFTAINSGTAPITAHIVVTPAASPSSCPGVARSFDIIVNPVATVDAIPNQSLCAGAPTAAANFTGAVPGTVYNWTNDNPAIGLAASGTGSIASFTATNTGTAALIAHITVTPSFTGSAVTCPGTPASFTITVNPAPSVAQPASQSLCNGTATAVVNFTGTIPGTVYSWTNNAPSIGLAASGTGDIAVFTAVNTDSAPVVATITVTPTAGSCPGAPKTFTITVGPGTGVNPVPSQTVCANTSVSAVTFSGGPAGTTYNWTNTNPAIGLAASGSGDIPSFTGTNAGSAAITGTITVTPVFSSPTNTCPGAGTSFTITINPVIASPAPANQMLCTGAPSTVVALVPASPEISYTWSNSNTATGLAASGAGSIPSFTATNTTAATLVSLITINTAYTNNAVVCTSASSFSITVVPRPVANGVVNQAVCNGNSFAAINFTGNPADGFIWSNDNPSIGLAASGNGNIPSFTGTNAGTAPLTANLTVTPLAVEPTMTCSGTPVPFTLTVLPTPSVNNISSATVCNGATVAAVNFSSAVAGTTYSWVNDNPSIGLAASGTGNVPSFTATNTGGAPVTATITVTPANAVCNGTAKTFTITVNPDVTVNAIAAQAICAGTATAAVNFSGNAAGTTYSWANSNPSIGLAASGTGNIPSFTAANAGTAPVTATITVTPTFTGGGTNCIGSSKTFTITVNSLPKPGPDKTIKICAGQKVNLTAQYSTAGLSTTWTSGGNPVADPAAVGPGIYVLTATNSNMCSATATVAVQQYAPINAQANASLTSVIEGQPILLTATGNGIISYEWSPAIGLQNAATASTTAVPAVSTNYQLAVKNIGGCADTAYVFVKVIPLDIEISGAFTPNGDGYTDKWIIRNIQYAKIANVMVMNRWGNKVFESGNYKNDWEGTFKGAPLPDGAYYYQVHIITAGNKVIDKSGSITLIR